MRLTAVSALGPAACAILLAACGGATPTRPVHAATGHTGPSASAGAPTGASGAGVTGSAGLRSYAAISSCLTTHAVANAPYVPPAGTQLAASAPQIMTVLPWQAYQLSVYDHQIASTASITTRDVGEVLASGNVAIAEDELPNPPPATLQTIEACAFGTTG